MIFSAYSGLELLEYMKKKNTFEFMLDLEKAGFCWEAVNMCLCT